MPRQAGTTVQNKFSRGLITEATGLNFPEDAVTSTVNCVFDKTGLTTRRFGIDFEDSKSDLAVTIQPVIHSYVWDIIETADDVDLVVVQLGSTLRFYETGGATLSVGIKSFTVDLTSFKRSGVADVDVRENRASFSTGDGILFVAHRFCDPFYVEYDGGADTIATTTVSIQVRDFEGTQEAVDVQDRPSTLTTAHNYDLDNQGWEDPVDNPAGTLIDPITEWDNVRTDFPSNADIWFQFKASNDTFTVGTFADRFGVGNTPAPKGHFIIDPFDVTRASVQTTSGTARPEHTAFFAGRVWWAGVRAAGYSSKLYFSKIIEGTDDFGFCYQQNDPTSEILSDLLPSDGGVISIQDISTVTGMIVILDRLIIFASNGVWSVSGTDTTGFTADNFKVTKISSLGALTPYSIVNVNGLPIWWAEDGIYTLSNQGAANIQAREGYSVQNLTRDSIQTFYDDIPAESKKYAQGAYDNIRRVVTWIYNTEATANLTASFAYDGMLNLDIDTGAFYPDEIGSSDAKVSSIINVEGRLRTEVSNNIIVGSNNVIDSEGDEIITTSETTALADSVNTFFITGTSGVYSGKASWGLKDQSSYLDWDTLTGVNFNSEFTTGYIIRGEGHKKFQTNYITLTSLVHDDSGFIVRGIRDYAVNNLSNLISTGQQGYKSQVNQKYSQRKLKLRGNGRVLQYRVSSEQGKAFNIAGWSFMTQLTLKFRRQVA